MHESFIDLHIYGISEPCGWNDPTLNTGKAQADKRRPWVAPELTYLSWVGLNACRYAAEYPVEIRLPRNHWWIRANYRLMKVKPTSITRPGRC